MDDLRAAHDRYVATWNQMLKNGGDPWTYFGVIHDAKQAEGAKKPKK